MINVRLLNLLKDAKKYIYYQVASQWIILILRILMTYTISYLVDSFINGNLSQSKIICGMIFSMIALYICYILEKFYVKATAKASLNVKRILRKKIYSKLLRLGISYNENIATSNLVQLSVEGVDQLEVCFGQYISQIYYSLIATFTSFFAICRISYAAAFSLLICVPLIPISNIIVQKIAKKILGKFWKTYTDLGETFLENLQGLTTLKIYQFDEQKALEMDNQSEKFRKETMKVLVMQLNSITLIDIMTYGGATLGMLVALSKYNNKIISFGGTITIIMLSAEFFLPLRRLSSFFHVAMNGMTASDKIFKFLDLKERENKKLFLENQNPIDIELKNVNFSFKEEKKILNNLNFSIKSNDFIAFVGESGCGKTTLARILSGNLNNYSGNITIQDKELNEINEESISKNIIVISSDSYIFKGTVKENLLMAKENATNQEMIDILNEVKLNEIFEKNGLDTVLLEEGQNLSGGQKQKIALARGLLVDAPFYIFDEATSNIDKESEADIMKAIKSLVGKKTIILISHRLGNVVDCDKIFLLQQGEIKESGTHEELLNLKSEYFKLYNNQKELENYSLTHKRDKKVNIIENLQKLKNDELILEEEKSPRSENENKTLKTELEQINVKNENISEKNINKLEVLGALFELVNPLMGIMFLAITFGSLGFLSAIFLSVKAIKYAFLYFEGNKDISYKSILLLMAISKGFLRYAEQYCNHFIAFKLLAIIRHKIFQKLRTLCPAKLENKDKGNLISLITSDIELIEVFYAHTISPTAIAFLISFFMIVYISSISFIAGLISLIAYCFIGIGIPIIMSPKLEKISLKYRNKTGDMNTFMLISLRGIRETLQYLNGQKRLFEIENKCKELADLKIELAKVEEIQKALTNLVVLCSSYGLFYILLFKLYNNQINLYETVVPMVCLISSFGPVIALSNLTMDLSHTIACGKRVKDLLDEEPIINEVKFNKKITDENLSIDKINFSYKIKNNEKPLKIFDVLKDFSCTVQSGKIIGIHGKSGCGKSTLLKLIMRFWDVDKGEIKFGNDDIKEIDTDDLRNTESYLTQETYLFNDTIEANIRLARENATKEDIILACKKASIHNFIMTLPNKYNTKVGELGGILSSGEKQRIGVARAFIHNPKLLLLDEPTSNLDSLNEGIILKSILEEQNEKSVIVVSHRESTLDCVDELIKFQ